MQSAIDASIMCKNNLKLVAVFGKQAERNRHAYYERNSFGMIVTTVLLRLSVLYTTVSNMKDTPDWEVIACICEYTLTDSEVVSSKA